MLKTLHHADGSTRQIHLGAWKKQSVDTRDADYALKSNLAAILPTSFDNRPICSPVEDQGDLGSCTANMLAGLVESNENRRLSKLEHNASDSVVVPNIHLHATAAKVSVMSILTHVDGSISFTTLVKPSSTPVPPPGPTPTPTPIPPTPPAPTPTPAPAKLVRASRLFEYYATRKIEGTVSEDSGASIRDAIKAAATSGVADESVWPYDISKFTVNPPDTVWAAAATHKVTSYHAITDGDIATMKSVLASGFLIGFGFTVYDYMMSAEMAKTGILHMPTASEQEVGGHAVVLVGYNDITQTFLVRNSWGANWGQNGYFTMPYAYIQNTSLSSDFWVVQSAPI